jgi:putative spermidine/putrescine transport system permease protein
MSVSVSQPHRVSVRRGVFSRIPRSATWLAVPPLLFVTAFFLFPAAYMFRLSVKTSTGGLTFKNDFSLGSYSKFFSDSFYLGTLTRTFLLAAGVTVLAVILGLPLAYLMARARRSLSIFLVLVVLLAMWVPLVVRVQGLSLAFQDSGPINDALQALHVTDKPVKLLYSPAAVVIGLLNLTLPWMVLSLFTAIRGIEPNLEQAARNLGATRARAFFEVVVPLARPGIGAGSIIVFTWAMGEYAVPVLLGGGSTSTMSQRIATSFFENIDWPLAAAMSIIMFVPIAVATALLSRWMSRTV